MSAAAVDDDDAASAETAKQTLAEWASKDLLGRVRLSDDGSSLSLDEDEDGTAVTTLPASVVVSVTVGDRSCRYSLASMFLQVVDPSQGLMAYRTSCKRYAVKDPVKALDKPTVVGYFLKAAAAAAGEEAGSAGAAAAATATTAATAATTSDDAKAPAAADADTAAAPAEVPTAAAAAAASSSKSKSDRQQDRGDRSDRKHHKSSSGSKHSKHPDRHRKDKHHRSSGGAGDGDERSPKKKAKQQQKLVTNEQLFSNLNVVVDKRQMDQQAHDEITMALSAAGFATVDSSMTPALLEEVRETTRAILANEIPVGDSSSILRATNPKKDLSRVLELYNESVKPGRGGSGSGGRDSKGGGGGSSSAAASAAAGGKIVYKKKYLVGKKPVIVVPKGMTAPITLINAHEFLSNGKFVPRDVMIKQGRQRSPPTTFTRTVKSARTGAAGLLEYEIVDNPKKLGQDPRQWERIVAVVVLGHTWQFKDWMKPYGSPVTLFSQTYGFYVGMEGDTIPTEVEHGWAVKRARLNRDKRGLDSVTFASFWNGLDEFMAVHKPELLPQPES